MSAPCDGMYAVIRPAAEGFSCQQQTMAVRPSYSLQSALEPLDAPEPVRDPWTKAGYASFP